MSTFVRSLRRQEEGQSHGRLRTRVALPLLATAVVGTAVVSGAPAIAAPPAHDDIANAEVVSGAGFSASADTREATYAASDPGCGAATVWYVFTPAADGRFVFDNTGSNYDTTLALLSGSPGALELLECHDDDSGRNERFVANLTAGTTYYIQAGTCCAGTPGQVGPGGDLVFEVSTAPPAIGMAASVQRRAKATRFGGAQVQGTVRCRPDATWAEVFVTIRQRQGDNVVRADGWREVRCTSNRRAWSLRLEHDSSTFKRKPALVRWSASACDDFTCDDVSGKRVVRLR